jgi:HK97 family phage portal protein
VTGNFQTSQALKRAGDDLAQAVKKAAKDKRQALVMPAGLEIKPIGADPDKSQMVETQRFCIEQIARLFNLPPIFLQDLTHGTYSNTEQQDLHFVKHTLKRWVEQFEQEINLKLFGYRSNRVYAEFNMDGLLRGDFKTRMDGYAQGVQSGVMMPSEARDRENLPFIEGSDKLFMQGATIPIDAMPSGELPNGT